jgi:DNA-binding response OmpR family regulator
MSAPPIIIVAEPDPLVSSVLRVELSDGNFAVLMAATAAEAEEYAAHAVANLVVMDVSVRKLAAYSACARIRRRTGYTKRPIVLTSVDVSEPMRLAAATAGATVLLPKPYSVSDLFAALASHVPPGDPLLTHRASRFSLAQEWTKGPVQEVRAGRDSTLTRNGLLLPIVRSAGVKIPYFRAKT